MRPLQYVKYEVRNSIAIITIDRPEARNAMLPSAWEELSDCLDDAAVNETVCAVILTGAGEKAFIAGGDIHDLQNRTPLTQLNHPISLQVAQKLEEIGKPVIAAINGACVGGGFEVALACDIRVAAAGAKFILPELNLGILPGAGGTQRLVRIVGLGRAKEMIMAGAVYTAQKACACGLVMEVVEREDLMNRAMDIAEGMMRKGPLAMSIVKKILNHAMDASLAEGLLAEQLGFMTLLCSEDRTEGMQAFLEKRAPHFQGK